MRKKKAPYVRGSSTSKEAADRIEPSIKTLQLRVKRFILERGEHGATDDEVEASLGLLHQTASARRRELVQQGILIDSGGRRATRSGRTATVWVHTDEPPPTPPEQFELQP